MQAFITGYPWVLPLYLLCIGAVVFFLCLWDKKQSKKGGRRTPEKTFILLGFLGGCFGMLLGMRAFRHKTKHMKFTVLIPLECLLWAGLLVYMYIVL